jgi:hypothetical protein
MSLRNVTGRANTRVVSLQLSEPKILVFLSFGLHIRSEASSHDHSYDIKPIDGAIDNCKSVH